MPGIIDAKARRPRPAGLARPRLVEQVVGRNAPGVVVVTAPPGAGKTTLLARAAELAAPACAWCSIGPEDRHGNGFLALVSKSLTAASATRLEGYSTVPALLEALTRDTAQPTSLFLDDVHELAGGPAEAQLAELIRWRPAQLRLVMSTRRPLPVNTPRLLVSGELTELEGEELRFRSWEVEELFQVVYDEPLSPEAAAALTRRTGGWAAGLKLFHLAITGKAAVERERAVAELSGRSRLLRSYLTRTVLDELDPERRRFLLMTSTLGTMTGALCDALLEREGSAAVLEDRAARQFFIIPAADGVSFRYHQVLQTLLEGLLVDELGPRAAANVYARGASLLEAAGLLRDAVRGYALAEDVASVARLVQHSDAGVAVDPVDTLALPVDDPWLALARARRLHRQGSIAAAVAAFRRADALLDDDDFRRRCRAGRTAAALWLPGGLPLGQRATGREDTDATGPAAVEELVRGATCHVGPLPADAPPLAVGIARLLAGDLTAARESLGRVRETSVVHRLVADLATAVVDLADGDPRDTVGHLEYTVLQADLEDQPWLARLARGLQAAVLLATQEEAWRADSCSALVDECRRDGDDWGATLLSGCLGVALCARQHPSAGDWLDRASCDSERLGAKVLQTWALALRERCDRRRRPEKQAAAGGSARASARACGLDPTVVDRVVGVRSHATATRPSVYLRCLGTFAIESGGQCLDLPPLRPLPRALLLLLAMNHGRDVHREVLIDRLWPDVTVEAASHRLHAAASSVRGCLLGAGLPEETVRCFGSAYRLDITGASSDVAEFEECAARARHAMAHDDPEAALLASSAALDLYRGDLLPEVGPAEWVVEERDRLRVAAATAAFDAGRLALTLRRLEQALAAARTATALDPLRDSAWALLAEVQTRMGDVTAAAATLRHHDSMARGEGVSAATPVLAR